MQLNCTMHYLKGSKKKICQPSSSKPRSNSSWKMKNCSPNTEKKTSTTKTLSVVAMKKKKNSQLRKEKEEKNMILPPYLEIHTTAWAPRGPGGPYQDSLPLVSPLTPVTYILCSEILVKDSLSVVTNLHNEINKQTKLQWVLGLINICMYYGSNQAVNLTNHPNKGQWTSTVFCWLYCPFLDCQRYWKG